MLHKRQTLNVTNRRSITTFFNRVTEIFERKFDGFVATVEDTNAVEVDANHELNIDVGAIIDEITDKILEGEFGNQCPDEIASQCVQAGGTIDCAGKAVNEELTAVPPGEWSEYREWEATMPVDYYVSVWADGLPLVKFEDYTTTTDGTVVINEELANEDLILTARYVVA